MFLWYKCWFKRVFDPAGSHTDRNDVFTGLGFRDWKNATILFLFFASMDATSLTETNDFTENLRKCNLSESGEI